jgi:D-erythronate 2-dehydrogenase
VWGVSILRILITGGAGFLGVRLARSLLSLGHLKVSDSAGLVSQQTIESIVLVDRATAATDLTADPRVQSVIGDMNTLFDVRSNPLQTFGSDIQLVFHLAAAVSGECEADFDLGMRSNIDATRALLEYCRSTKRSPIVVFASSLAVFGNSPQQPMPTIIQDTTLPTPQSSYGIQKFICEQLVADYGRKGFIRARNVRLMTVSVRPGKPNGAASSFLSGMIREPLSGLVAICPVDRNTPVALSSPSCSVDGLLVAAQTSDQQWGARTAINFPALSTTVGEMANALKRVAGEKTAALIDWKIDPTISRIVGSWPSTIHAQRANALGLVAEKDFDDIIAAHIRENHS